MAQALFGDGRGRVLVFCWLGWVFDFYDLILYSLLKPVWPAQIICPQFLGMIYS